MIPLKSRTVAIILLSFSAIAPTFARIAIKTDDTTINLGISTAGWTTTGQYMGLFTNSNLPQSRQWLQQTYLDLGVDAIINNRLKIVGALEGEMWQDNPKGGASSQAYYVWRYNSTFIVDKAYGEYSFGDLSAPWLDITVGHFPYKYNPDVRNLGEYLFRSGTYPAFLITNFDEPFAWLTGFKFGSDFAGRLHQDFIVSFSTDLPPYYDASLTYIANLNCGKLFNVGWGAQWANLISVNEDQTTPKNSDGASQIMYVQGGDTGYYTFRGIKLMARFDFDPKPLFPNPEIFGKEDCKLYGEAAILGLQSYPANDSGGATIDYTSQKNPFGYDTLAQKIPVTLGFNFPTFKFLNVLGTEVEWYGCNYPNNLGYVIGKGSSPSLPLPYYYQREPYDYDHWKWSVYAKKTFLHDHFGIVVQCARDHSRLQTLQDDMAYWELEEAQSLPNQWYWMTELIAQF